SVTNAAGSTSTFLKDVRGYIKQASTGDGRITVMEHDLAGRVSQVTRTDGSVVTNVYDSDDGVAHFGDLLSQGDTATGISTSQFFDVYGNLIAATNGRGLTTFYDYDPQTGLLASVT